MGNWHCITSDCATVHYREYLPPLVRWRYPEEDWQEIIEADDYSLEQDWYGGQNPNIQYRYKYGRAAISGGVLVGWATFYSSKPSGVIFPISDLRLLIKGVDYNQYEHWAFKGGGSGNPPPDGSRSRRYIMQVKDATGTWKSWLNTSSQGHRVYGLEPADGSIENNPGGSNCIFTVTKNGEIVHQETRDVCPEVEQLPCRLSDVYKEIKIDKVPYLNRVQFETFSF